MYNIDTICFSMACSRKHNKRNFFTHEIEEVLDWNYTVKMMQKITCKMQLYEEDKQNMNKILNCERYKGIMADVFWHRYYNGYSFSYYENWHSLTVMTPHYIVEEATASEIIDKVTETIMELYELRPEELNEIVLNRIDIKCDYRYKDEEEFEIIKNILDKITQQYYCYERKLFENDEKGYLLKYQRSKGDKVANGPLFSGIRTVKNKAMEKEEQEEVEDDEYDIGNYMEMAEYNKTLEIEEKIAQGKVPESYRDKYMNVFRTEVRIRNGRLNHYKNVDGVSKELATYYNYDKTSKLYNKPTKAVFGTNDFFRIDVAIEIIKDAKMRESTRKKLCKLIRLVNKKGYTSARERWQKNFSDSTFTNHKKKIEELGINIITFDKEIDGKKVDVEMIENFTLLENGIPDYISKNIVDEIGVE